jgi:hypothetical protein
MNNWQEWFQHKTDKSIIWAEWFKDTIVADLSEDFLAAPQLIGGGQMLGNAVGGRTAGSAISYGIFNIEAMSRIWRNGWQRRSKAGPGFLSRQLERAVGPDTANKLKTPIGPLNSLSRSK